MTTGGYRVHLIRTQIGGRTASVGQAAAAVEKPRHTNHLSYKPYQTYRLQNM